MPPFLGGGCSTVTTNGGPLVPAPAITKIWSAIITVEKPVNDRFELFFVYPVSDRGSLSELFIKP
jgi:hypothetical protein